MCGIVGYVGKRSAQDVLLDGLEKLEYRGYDSAGVALALDGGWAKKVHAKIQSSAPLFCVAQLALLLLMVLSVMFMVNSTYSPFIYFQY